MRKAIGFFMALWILLLTGCGQAAVTPPTTPPVPDGEVVTVAQAAYPKMTAYPDPDDPNPDLYTQWLNDRKAQKNQQEGYADGLEDFYARTIPAFLSDTDGENRVYSPLNVYMALGMLAELSGGNSRQQILDLLGSADIDALRSQATALWNANYCDDGAVKSVLASSLWLNRDLSFKKNTLDVLADTYHASSFRGEMGSQRFNEALQDWLNEQTGGRLEQQVKNIQMDADTVLALATTVFFKAKWAKAFFANKTTPQIFDTRGETGEVTCDFLHDSSSQMYYAGARFAATGRSFSEAGTMWFLLPDEGVSVNQMLADAEAVAFLTAGGDVDGVSHPRVHLSVPKFDVTSELELRNGLNSLGVTDVFHPQVSDFTPVTENTKEIYVGSVKHDARVTMDEDGCTATAFTVILATSAGLMNGKEEEVTFTADRPFVFLLTGLDGAPLFVGVVNNPVR